MDRGTGYPTQLPALDRAWLDADKLTDARPRKTGDLATLLK
jgi:hypothetical protein